MNSPSEGDRVLLGMSGLQRYLSRQLGCVCAGRGGGGEWEAREEILYYDLFPSSLKIFSYRHANISSF